jgi:uncharacterized protein (TIGR02996 family)
VTHDDAFLKAIIDTPEDDTPRLVYADFLDERGDPRGEFIRVQCELARLPDDDPRRLELEARERGLLKEHKEEWVGPMLRLLGGSELVAHVEFRRGFVWGLTIGASDFLLRAENLFRGTPLQHARICMGPEAISALAASPWLARLTSLSLESCDLQASDIHPLADSPFLTSVTTLDLYENQIGSRGLRALAASPHLHQLRELRLGGNGITSAGLRALAASPLLGRLTHLDLFYNRVGTAGVVALANSPHAASLLSLGLGGNEMGNVGGRVLAASPHLVNLTCLDLYNNRITEPVREVLRARFGDRVII